MDRNFNGYFTLLEDICWNIQSFHDVYSVSHTTCYDLNKDVYGYNISVKHVTKTNRSPMLKLRRRYIAVIDFPYEEIPQIQNFLENEIGIKNYYISLNGTDGVLYSKTEQQHLGYGLIWKDRGFAILSSTFYGMYRRNPIGSSDPCDYYGPSEYIPVLKSYFGYLEIVVKCGDKYHTISKDNPEFITEFID